VAGAKRSKRSPAETSNLCFLDTSALIALAFTADQNHPAARRSYDQLRFSNALFVMTYFVFAETMIYLRRRASVQTAVKEGERLLQSSQVLIVEGNSQLHAVGWEIFKKYKDWKDLSYTDCMSFALMQQMGITRAFTFDSDFQAYGFISIPSDQFIK
jgi:uncharacterized protein